MQQLVIKLQLALCRIPVDPAGPPDGTGAIVHESWDGSSWTEVNENEY